MQVFKTVLTEFIEYGIPEPVLNCLAVSAATKVKPTPVTVLEPLTTVHVPERESVVTNSLSARSQDQLA